MKNVPRFLMKLSCVLIMLGLLAPARLLAQQPVLEDTTDLSVFFDTAKAYPSLTPRTFIKVGFGAIFDITGVDTFNPASPGVYILEKLDAAGNPSGEKFHPERVDVVTVGGEQQGVAYLSLDARSSGLKTGDKFRLGMLVQHRTSTGGSQPKIFWHSGGAVTVPSLDNYTLKLEPNIVPNQALTDGTKKTVGQFQFKLDVPSLVANNNVARVYLVTDNLFSTDGKDKSSKVDIKLGAERTLLNSWYVPGNVEAKLNGDQRFKNSSFILSTGVKTILPWAWTKSLLFNSLVKAPISPEFEFSAQYQRRLRQDAEAFKKHPDKNSFRGFTQVAWNPIHLLTGKKFSPNDISLELLGKAWWFPFDKTSDGAHVRKLAGQFETSLLIPLGGIKIADQLGGPLSFLKKPDSGANMRLRIKFTRGANEATGFKHVSQFTFGVEASK